MSTPSNDFATKAPSNNLNRQLGLYSLAAAAAGVSMLALAQPAAGEVVITRKTIPIGSLVYLDMNHDGVADFTFYNSYSSALRSCGWGATEWLRQPMPPR
jgi:hypothetical protein